LILRIGLTTAKNSAFALMDVSPGKKIEQGVVKAIESVAGIEEFYDLRLRQSGPFVLGETKIGIRKSIDVEKAHEIADRVENEVKKNVFQIESFMVHVEPFKNDWRHLVFPVSEKQELNSKISDNFSRALYFLFVNFKKDKLKGFYFLKNPYKGKKVKTGLAVAKLVIKQKSDILITKEIGEITYFALKDNMFDIFQSKDIIVKKAINNFLGGNLRELKKATKSF